MKHQICILIIFFNLVSFCLFAHPADVVDTKAKTDLNQAKVDKKYAYLIRKSLIFQAMYLIKCSEEEIEGNGYDSQLVRDFISVWNLRDKDFLEKDMVFDSIVKTTFFHGPLKNYPMPETPSEDKIRLVVDHLGGDIDLKSRVKIYQGFKKYLDTIEINDDLILFDFLKS